MNNKKNSRFTRHKETQKTFHTVVLCMHIQFSKTPMQAVQYITVT